MKRTSFLNRIVLFILIAGIFTLLAYFAVNKGVQVYRDTLQSTEGPDIFELWETGHYQDIISITETILQQNPMDSQGWFFNGASLFYFGISQNDREYSQDLLDHSIFSLRKYLSLKELPFDGQAYYLLGKCYIHKGSHYSDLALANLLHALEKGYSNPDIKEYLAEAYSSLGDYESSLQYLNAIAEESPTDRVYIKIAENSFENGDYDRAEEYYLEALKETKDSIIYQDVLFRLSSLYYDLKNYEQSIKVLSQYLEIDYNNRDAHFMLGESFYHLGDKVSARTEWRRAERIDPYYRPVLVRLYN